MVDIFNWIKNHKIVSILVTVIIFLIAAQVSDQVSSPSYSRGGLSVGMGSMESMMEGDFNGAPIQSYSKMMPIMDEIAPSPEATNRLVVSTSYLSLAVDDVSESVAKAIEYAQSLGGYMVQSTIARPEEGGTATVVLRVPADKLPEALSTFKNQAKSVVSESLEGNDVTDRYVNNEEKLRILNENKTRFEAIMAEATQVQDILQVQQEIFSIQSQIDAIEGAQQYLEQTSQTAKLTLYLSTDELALPYAPTDSWQPAVVFKSAIRSLIGSMRSIGTLMIWFAVYAVIWVPVVLIIWLVYWFRRRRIPR